MESVFDLVYEPVPTAENAFDDTLLKEGRVKFSEMIDKLKKEKLIKATLAIPTEVIVGSIVFIFGLVGVGLLVVEYFKRKR